MASLRKGRGIRAMSVEAELTVAEWNFGRIGAACRVITRLTYNDPLESL
jgi:hypothetical protein